MDNKTPTRDTKAKRQAERIAKLEYVLGTLIAWIGQSSVGVLSVNEANTLLRELSNK